MTGNSRPQGRPIGVDNTRNDILKAAQQAFAAHGYDGASVRTIAAQANVDPSTVLHFYKTKLGIFQAVAQDAVDGLKDVKEALTQHKDGASIARLYFSAWEATDTGPSMKALIRTSIGNEATSKAMREIVVAQVIDQQDTESHLALELCMSHLLGTAINRYISGMPELQNLPLELLIERTGSVLDTLRKR